ncbi:MAG: hypothetical protein KDC87_04415 [Planctomycetes bacterium]|nr:hypothetical protein [Planctomycetota bacterium]MCB9868257.1 hypothetical protein [Planctomycetota bacterium]MCB9888767.1 hypothetical protein [Planctomycetota bacterium]
MPGPIAFLIAVALACSGSLTLVVLVQLGLVRVSHPEVSFITPHLAWICALVCAAFAALRLRGRLRSYAVPVLAGLAVVEVAALVVLPPFGVRVLPHVEEVARVHAGPGDLVGLRVESPRDGRQHIALCVEHALVPGIAWLRVLDRCGPAAGVAFSRVGRNRYLCSFAPSGRSRLKPRIVNLPSGSTTARGSRRSRR